MKCAKCDRPALYVRRKRGGVGSRKDHDLCQRCWRDACNSQREIKPKEAKE